MFARNTKIGWSLFVLVSVLFSSFAMGQTEVALVAARHVPGSFVGDRAVWADENRIYTGSFEGYVSVYSRNRSQNFPFVERIDIDPAGNASIVSVRGDKECLYVLTDDGKLRTFKKSFPCLQFVRTEQVSTSGADSLVLADKHTFVSSGQAEMDVDQTRVYFSPLNEGDLACGFAGRVMKTSSRPTIYGVGSEPGFTSVYDRKTGGLVGSIANPQGIQQVAIYGDATRLFLTVPGPFGQGIAIHNKSDLSPNRFVWFYGTNVVTNAKGGKASDDKDLIVVGTEAGTVDLLDLNLNYPNSPHISCVNLRVLTGHTGPEDIEIRALWCDGLDNLVFAVSSGGNQQPQNPNLPTFFVIEVR